MIDPAKVRKTPAEWADEEGVVIIQPNGWDSPAALDIPITYSEYHMRALMSVLGPAGGTTIELAVQSDTRIKSEQ